MRPLRDYQQRAIAGVIAALKAGYRNVLIVAPTGAGKTRIGVEFVARAVKKGTRVLWLAHRSELITQAVSSMRMEGIQAGIVAPWAARTTTLVQVASIQTLLARGEVPPADLVIVDEAHHIVAQEWGTVLNVARTRGTIILGLTATPERGDGAPLGDVFHTIVPVAQPRELIAAGHLVPVDVWAPNGLVQGTMADPVQSWVDHPQAKGKRTIVFCQNVTHAQDLAERWQKAGFPAACVDGEMKLEDRQRELNKFARGETTVLTNVFVLTEGFDLPAIEVVVLARGFTAQGTYIQAVGRALRPSQGKERALILDCKRAVDAHGLPDDDREYSLEGKAIKAAERLEPLRQCKHCGAVFAAAGKKCPRCGMPVPRPLSPSEKQAKLDRVRQVATVSDKRSYLEFLQFEATRKGYAAGWAAYRFKSKYGHWPQRELWRHA